MSIDSHTGECALRRARGNLGVLTMITVLSHGVSPANLLEALAVWTPYAGRKRERILRGAYERRAHKRMDKGLDSILIPRLKRADRGYWLNYSSAE